MVLCIIAAVVLSVLAIFSASHRKLAIEAWKCVFNMVRLRPCETGFDDKIKAQVVGAMMLRSKILAKLTYKYFTLLSWIFVILSLVSMFFFVQGIYSFALYGNCNGPNSTEFCIYRGLLGGSGGNYSIEGTPSQLVPPTSLAGHSLGPTDAPVTIIEFGCYSCPFTAKSERVVKQVLEDYAGKVRFIFKPFPLPNHPFSRVAAHAAECAGLQGKYWEYKDALFARQADWRENGNPVFIDLARGLGLNETGFTQCVLGASQTCERIDQFIDTTFQEGLDSKIYGTPTFFINGKPLVGPQPYESFKALIDAELAKAGE
ncbi:MAG: thioredoxin domain-containing protein [Candidatus Burarchaeum sp.]|nr:thioredoxin domain-containing protein [Candidatus Burarchaeum sp.]MDO8339437.1 thioredoxin domain-containing protein [Candidatus Burarchaeum sp.]